MPDMYADMGVDVSEADLGIQNITRRIKTTWTRGPNRPLLDIGYFANIVNIGGGRGLAMTTDGVGSKTLVCDLMNKYDTIGIDCVAMNVNDLICVGAVPSSMVDYIAVEHVDNLMLDEIAKGLVIGALAADISVPGGEVSQLPDNINGFDLVGAAFGLVDLDRVIDGHGVEVGDSIIGIASNGIHANGMTMARRVLLDGSIDYRKPRDDLNGLSIGEELLRPTNIYVQEVLDLLDNFDVQALINITGDGLLNLNRIYKDGVGFKLDKLPEPPPIFNLIRGFGDIDDATMFQTFNMGVGFCVIVPPDQEQSVLLNIHDNGKLASVIGHVVEDPDDSVFIPQWNLIGQGKRFHKV